MAVSISVRLVWFSIGDMIATVVELSSVVIVAVGNMLRKLHTSDSDHLCVHSDMKNAVIGNNKQKANLIVLGAVPRCLSLFTCFLIFLFLLSPHALFPLSSTQSPRPIEWQR